MSKQADIDVRDARDRDAAMQAAAAFDRAMRERNDLMQEVDDLVLQVKKAMEGLEAKNTLIHQLELALAEERNRVATYQSERDETFRENARLEMGLSNALDILQALALATPPAGNKPPRGLNGNGGAVPNAGASPKAVANSPALLAHP
jgi:chromosome segregation ATPase